MANGAADEYLGQASLGSHQPANRGYRSPCLALETRLNHNAQKSAEDGTVSGNKTMKALLLRQHGGLENLEVVERPSHAHGGSKGMW